MFVSHCLTPLLSAARSPLHSASSEDPADPDSVPAMIKNASHKIAYTYRLISRKKGHINIDLNFSFFKWYPNRARYFGITWIATGVQLRPLQYTSLGGLKY
ncbi:hypothetical protein FRX31_033395 [Thalictrum thalictroides]|uniref:Uncharacterized protein n=1 Tax=Thalictrum thalictroides TaxID=46969 RepID=A0A7J6UX58_THATH|nr:hypothetical protein FRX31_033395 [Thalictrum thalictroides]